MKKDNTIYWIIGIAIVFLVVANSQNIFQIEGAITNGYYHVASGECRVEPDIASGQLYFPDKAGPGTFVCCFNAAKQQVDCNNPSDLLGPFAIYNGAIGSFFVQYGVQIYNSGNVDLTDAWIESSTWWPAHADLSTAFNGIVGPGFGGNIPKGGAIPWSAGVIDLQAVGGPPGSPITYTWELMTQASVLGLPDTVRNNTALVTIEQEGIHFDVNISSIVTSGVALPIDYVGYWSFDVDARDNSGNGNDGAVRVRASAYYPFDGNANDESQNSNHGTVTGATLTTDHLGNVNNAYSFDGIDDSVSFGDVGKLEVQNLTISVWIKPIDNTQNQMIISKNKGTSDGSNSYFLALVGSQSEYWFRLLNTSSDTEIVKYSVNSVALNVWHHFVATYDGQDMKLYVDGTLANEINWPNQIIQYGDGEFDIGCEHDASYTDNFFNGSIDEVMILNKALTANEVLALYDTTKVHKLNNPHQTGKLNNDLSLWGGGRGTDKATEGSYIELNSNLDVDSNSHSLSFWYKTTDDNFQMLFQSYLDSGSSNIELQPSGNILRFESRANNYWDKGFSTGIDVDDGEWHHYSLVFSPTDSKLYTDGSLTDTEIENDDAALFRYRLIGGYGNLVYTYGEMATGEFDEVMIFNRDLSADEINIIYISQK